MKRCSSCKTEKPVGKFSPDRRQGDGLQSRCRDCQNESNRKWRTANPGHQRSYYAKTREQRRAYARAYYAANREKCVERARKWRADNPERAKEVSRTNTRRRMVVWTQHGGISRGLWNSYLNRNGTPSCDLCGTTDPGHRYGWHTDHDHAHGCSGYRGCIECVRGALCHACNTGEGMLDRFVRLGLVTVNPASPIQAFLDPATSPFQVWLRAQQQEAA